jgi:hypothetical protein
MLRCGVFRDASYWRSVMLAPRTEKETRPNLVEGALCMHDLPGRSMLVREANEGEGEGRSLSGTGSMCESISCVYLVL